MTSTEARLPLRDSGGAEDFDDEGSSAEYVQQFPSYFMVQGCVEVVVRDDVYQYTSSVSMNVAWWKFSGGQRV